MGQNIRIRPKRISRTELNKWVRTLPDGSFQLRTYSLSLLVLRRFLGEEWVGRHIRHGGDQTGFFKQSQEMLNNRILALDHITTVAKLADMLFNMQFTTNFDACLSQLSSAKGNQLETTYAELETAMLLFRCRVPFRFVEPIQKRGFDYDFEIIMPGNTVVAADTKCKVTGLLCSERTVYNVLHDSIGQVPPSLPSFFFLKIPETWIQPANDEMVMSGVRRFLSGTGRVASVKIHVEHRFLPHPRKSEQTYIVKEIANPQCRFLRGQGWDIFVGVNNLREWHYISYFAGAKAFERRFV
jgi:hypothetical protein